jgi:hypothetical protein
MGESWASLTSAGPRNIIQACAAADCSLEIACLSRGDRMLQRVVGQFKRRISKTIL